MSGIVDFQIFCCFKNSKSFFVWFNTSKGCFWAKCLPFRVCILSRWQGYGGALIKMHLLLGCLQGSAGGMVSPEENATNNSNASIKELMRKNKLLEEQLKKYKHLPEKPYEDSPRGNMTTHTDEAVSCWNIGLFADPWKMLYVTRYQIKDSRSVANFNFKLIN